MINDHRLSLLYDEDHLKCGELFVTGFAAVAVGAMLNIYNWKMVSGDD